MWRQRMEGKSSLTWYKGKTTPKYGEYTELCGLLHKYMRPTDAILVAGCGNSTLSADLYRVGYSQITSVDNSEVVIRQMRDKYKQQCPKMEWLKMDLSAMDFEDGSFSCVLDKAALDALMTDASLPVIEFIDKYLNVTLNQGSPLKHVCTGCVVKVSLWPPPLYVTFQTGFRQ
ncbi:Methyltransferase-like protein 13 [Chionoecetes opilio]|uniref:Methyltransferase-like protein 13 n=1 Tax=Chionoecetes opilio TaxID=41210 RepID=A0A8J4YJ81_CHIOP|nr:Methyltransferase-like protein 13 [Chionoecetes opilio]